MNIEETNMDLSTPEVSANEQMAEESVQDQPEVTQERQEEAHSEVSRGQLKAAIEAILFATGRAVPREDLVRALEIAPEEVDALIAQMKDQMAADERGVEIIELDSAYQMCTKTEFYPQLIKLELTPKKPRLTDVALETLSVIAYKQPVTKAEIERIRGVNSDHAVNKLIEYHLVTELGRAKQPGRPILFGTTQEFLRAFGVSSKENLPEISPIKVADFREEAEEEAGLPSSSKAEEEADLSGTSSAVEENGLPDSSDDETSPVIDV